MTDKKLYETGIIHGRFQVFHNDHMDYIIKGLNLCRHLVIGITNPDPTLTKAEITDPFRSSPASNPLTYYERLCCITASLSGAGIAPDRFSIVPFPINFPELYVHYVPLDGTFFLTIYDDWGRAKKKRFEDMGLAIEVLRDVSIEKKGISATGVRDLMKRGEQWEQMVPVEAAALYKEWNIPARIRGL